MAKCRIHVCADLLKVLLFVCIAAASSVHAQKYEGIFRDIQVVSGLDSQFRDETPYVTPDGLTIYFASDRPSTLAREDFTLFDLWVAERDSVSEPFREPVKLDSQINLDTIGEFDPELSEDMRFLYFFSGSGPGSRDGQIWVSERTSPSAPWGEPKSVGPEVSVPEREDISPAVTRDGRTMFFAGGANEGDLFQATRATDSGPFENVMPLENLNTDQFPELFPSVSSNGLVLFYQSDRGPAGFAELWVATRASTNEAFDNPMNVNDFGLGSSINMGNTAEFSPFISHDWPSPGSKLYFGRAFGFADWDIVEATWHVALLAGDADQDLDFDQRDLVQVQIAAKYLTGQAATWGEGDWNGATDELVASPPEGDGLFNQNDVVAALSAGTYLTGPYAAVGRNGQVSDGQTSVVYNAGTGELAVDAPAAVELTSINIDSAAGIFTGSAAQNLGGSFDNDGENNIFKATFGGSFGSLSFGSVAQTGLSEQFVLGDLSVVGSLSGGGDLGNVDLIYVPESTSSLLLATGLVVGLLQTRRTRG